MRNAVEVAFQIGVHHIAAAVLDQGIHLAQSVLAGPPRPEAIARWVEHCLEYRFDDELDRRLDDPVLDHRDAQRSCRAIALRDLNPPYRQRTVLPGPQALRKLSQISLRPSLEPFDALPIHAR